MSSGTTVLGYRLLEVEVGRPSPDESGRTHEFTARGRPVAARAVTGSTNLEIAKQMSMSDATVAYHLKKVI